MVEETSDEWENGRHLLEVLQRTQHALEAFWRLAAPLLSRNAPRNLMGSISWSYYQVSDGLTHSVEWLKAMPIRASDGTSVWPEAFHVEQPPAVTNEVSDDTVDRQGPHGDDERRRRQELRSSERRAGTGGWDEVQKLRYALKVEKQKAAKTPRPRYYRARKRRGK